MNVLSSSSSAPDIQRVNCGTGLALRFVSGVQPLSCGTGVWPVSSNASETRNGSNQAMAQYVWGTQYPDEILYADVNGDPTESDDCDPDDQAGESTADTRYFYHRDGNGNVVALSQYSETGDAYTGLVERYGYTPCGEFVVLTGESSPEAQATLIPWERWYAMLLPHDHDLGRVRRDSGRFGPCSARGARRITCHEGRHSARKGTCIQAPCHHV
jgi:hypothetical protein